MTRPLARSTGVPLPRHLPLPAHALTMMLCCPLISSFQIASCSSVPVSKFVLVAFSNGVCTFGSSLPVLNDALGMFDYLPRNRVDLGVSCEFGGGVSRHGWPASLSAVNTPIGSLTFGRISHSGICMVFRQAAL